MTLHRLLLILRRHWLVIAAGPVIGLGLAIAYTSTQPAVYSASAELFVSTTTEDKNGSDLVNSGLYASNLVSSYAGVATSPAVLDRVVTTLDLDMTAAELERHVTATVPLNTVLVRVDVAMDDPEVAADVANAIAQQLPAVVEALTRPSADVAAPVELRVIRSAAPDDQQIAPKPALNALVGLVLGGTLGLAVAMVLEGLRRRITSVVEVESATGLPVIGILPDDDHHPGATDAQRLVWSSVIAATGHAPRSVLLTSASESSRVAKVGSRLADVIAETDRTVAWVDTDLLGGRASTAMGIERSPGLAEVLAGDAELDETVRPWRDSALAVVPSGARTHDLGKAFSGPGLATVADSLRAGFETVVFDATGLSQLPEIALLGQHVDAVVLVVTPSSKRRDLADAVRGLNAAGLTLAGVVIDEVPDRDRADFERRFLSSDDILYDA